MESIVVLLALCVLALPLIAVLVAASARSQAGELRAWLSGLQHRTDVQGAALASLQQRLDRLEVAAHAGSSAATMPAPIVATPAAPVAPVQAPLHLPATPVVTPSPVMGVEPEPRIEPSVERVEPPVIAPPVGRRPSLEQWLGARGAAALGAVVLILAGLYFFKYTVDQGLLSDVMRVGLGAAAGLVCLAGAELFLRKRHALLASCVSGAGIAILYTTLWAAAQRYHVIDTRLAAPLMVAVTAAACVLAVKRRAAPIAGLGLVGGFVTPVLLATGHYRPLVLFGYLLLLDAALLVVARLRRWPALATASVVATAGYQAHWLLTEMRAGSQIWSMVLATVFAVLFVALGRGRARAEAAPPAATELWTFTRLLGLLMPFVLALYLGLAPGAMPRFVPLAAFVVPLVVAVVWLARREEKVALAMLGTGGGIGVVAAWVLRHPGEEAWLVTGVMLVLAALGLAIRWRRRSAAEVWIWLAGSMALATFQGAFAGAVWPGLVGLAVLSPLALVLGWQTRRAELDLLVGGGTGFALLTIAGGQLPAGASSRALGYAIVGVLALLHVVAHCCAALDQRSEAAGEARLARLHGVALASLLSLWGIAGLALAGPQLALVVVVVVLSLAVVAVRAEAPGWWLAAAIAVALVMAAHARLPGESHFVSTAALAVAFAVLPQLSPRPLRADAWTWRAVAMAPLAFALPLYLAWPAGWRLSWLTLALAGLSLAGLWLARSRADGSVKRSAFAWLGGTSLTFIAVTLPLELEREWLTIGVAILAVGLLALWRRVGHPGLRFVAYLLSAVVTVRLVANPYLLDYHPRGGGPFNWLAYTYLVPLACLAIGAWLCREPRAHDGAPEPLARVGARLLAAAAVVVGFVYVNLAIFDWFGVGAQLEVNLERLPGRDLSLSIAWLLYGLVLLALAVWRRTAALRRASLVLVIATCAKVFLYDLSHLADLHRVLSLVGLAIALIAVSLAYQRFVVPMLEREEAS